MEERYGREKEERVNNKVDIKKPSPMTGFFVCVFYNAPKSKV